VALNAAKNAGILAAEMIGAFDEGTGQKIADYKQQMNEEVLQKVSKLKEGGWSNQFD
jgi:5-(carboxyamino)imidazole ribonucleotide mutase